MEKTNFKGDKKRFLIWVLGTVILGLGLGVINIQTSSAGYEIECATYSSECVSHYESCVSWPVNFCNGFISTCSVNATHYGDTIGDIGGSANCKTAEKVCQTGKCPADDSDLAEGDLCTIRILDSSNNVVASNNSHWDKDEGKCIQCDDTGYKQTAVCGDTSGLYLSILGPCTGMSSYNNKLEYACNSGIVPDCDEKAVGDVCTGGTCSATGLCVAGCIAGNPSVTVSPSSYTGPASVQTFTISATRNDSAACNSASIPLEISCTAGNMPSWTSGSTPATAYNGTGIQTVDVNITASGSCAMTAKSPDDNTKTDSEIVNITISAATPTPTGSPTATPTSTPTSSPTATPTTSPTPPTPTSSCDYNDPSYCNPLRGTVNNIVQAAQKLIAYILGLISFIALLVIIISGLTYITSAGNEQKIESAKRILTSAATGLVIAVLAYGFLQVIITILNKK